MHVHVFNDRCIDGSLAHMFLLTYFCMIHWQTPRQPANMWIGLDCIDMHILPWSGMYILTSFVWRMYWHLVHLGWRFRHKYFAMAYFGRHLAAFAGAFWALDTCATEKKGCGVGSCCVEYTILYWVLQSAHTSITSKQLLTIGLRAVIWLHYARRLSLRNG